MLVVRGRSTAELHAGEVDALLEGYERVVADVGTGDGRFAYALARKRPSWFVVGIDPVKEALREISHRASRKPGRGGLPNVAFVWASVERPPVELRGRASEIYVVLPWGKLLAGLLLPLGEVLDGIAQLARPGAELHLILNGEPWAGEEVPLDVSDLPEPTEEHAREVLAPSYAGHGLHIHEARWLSPEEVRAIPSTWARRLAHGRQHPRFLYVGGTAHGPWSAQRVRDTLEAG